MKRIPVRGRDGEDKFALVDDEDYEVLKEMRWGIASGYALAYIPVSMHRLIMGTPKGMVTDHINGDRLDNQRHNLRVCTQQQNAWNQRVQKRGKSSQYKGVDWYKPRRKWRTKIKVNRKQVEVGFFLEEQHAALAYDMWAIEMHGEFARTNFPVVKHSSWLTSSL